MTGADSAQELTPAQWLESVSARPHNVLDTDCLLTAQGLLEATEEQRQAIPYQHQSLYLFLVALFTLIRKIARW